MSSTCASALASNSRGFSSSSTSAAVTAPFSFNVSSSFSDSPQRFSDSGHWASASSAAHPRVSISTSAAASAIQQHLSGNDTTVLERCATAAFSNQRHLRSMHQQFNSSACFSSSSLSAAAPVLQRQHSAATSTSAATACFSIQLHPQRQPVPVLAFSFIFSSTSALAPVLQQQQ